MTIHALHSGLLYCEGASLGKQFSEFGRNASLTLNPWRRRRHISSERREPLAQRSGVTSKNTGSHDYTAVRNPNTRGLFLIFPKTASPESEDQSLQVAKFTQTRASLCLWPFALLINLVPCSLLVGKKRKRGETFKFCFFRFVLKYENMYNKDQYYIYKFYLDKVAALTKHLL